MVGLIALAVVMLIWVLAWDDTGEREQHDAAEL